MLLQRWRAHSLLACTLLLHAVLLAMTACRPALECSQLQAPPGSQTAQPTLAVFSMSLRWLHKARPLLQACQLLLLALHRLPHVLPLVQLLVFSMSLRWLHTARPLLQAYQLLLLALHHLPHVRPLVKLLCVITRDLSSRVRLLCVTVQSVMVMQRVQSRQTSFVHSRGYRWVCQTQCQTRRAMGTNHTVIHRQLASSLPTCNFPT
jgi:hypothetical protein